MYAKGLPENVDEARGIVRQTAELTDQTPVPGHWPHSQVTALAHLAVSLEERLARLENALGVESEPSAVESDPPRRGPGRPRKEPAPV